MPLAARATIFSFPCIFTSEYSTTKKAEHAYQKFDTVTNFLLTGLKLVSVLTRLFGLGNIELGEDVVQDFLAAIEGIN